ncbi:hypothetical protein PFICI_13261 [Pestalotiopsis fici W106-1]|uniref:Uncharacterized protein n=1 Tax=Pestalotiopsis fici (strain W106-1 / CGMCC3.15140) TaxID=1229662 RepID=W3WNT6_PESFW|nr:uncharacterized protein PFICI_13261 [Pestalotiopsis fici W106-1]ETS74777.1 hypothetical protein PFICI_13261 [Pestalotiopsis fici W106-1]
MHLSHHHQPPPQPFPAPHHGGPAAFGAPPSPPRYSPPHHEHSHHHHHHHHHCCCGPHLPPPPSSRARALSATASPSPNVLLIDKIPDLNAGNMPPAPPLSPAFAGHHPVSSPRRSPSPPGIYQGYHPSSLSPRIGGPHHHHHHDHRNGPPLSPRRRPRAVSNLPPPPPYKEDCHLIDRIPPMGAPGNNGPPPAWGLRGEPGVHGHHHGGWR